MLKTGNALIDNSTAEWVIGSDEVGYGAWAGPLVVCATLVHRSWTAAGVGDSKKIVEKERERICDHFTQVSPVTHLLVWVTPKKIDELGVYKALVGAHQVAILGVMDKAKSPPLVIVDGFPQGTGAIGVHNAVGLPKADGLVSAVGLASIIAKVTRDRFMQKQSQEYPGYGFGNHKGYGTPEHERALDKLGVCAIHRKSYDPIRKRLKTPRAGQDDPLFEID
jgi:ribonuclease HII